MKNKKQDGPPIECERVKVFDPPPHEWRIPEFIAPALETDGKVPFYLTQEYCGNDKPNETWGPDALTSCARAAITLLAFKALKGDGLAAEELAILTTFSTEHLTKVCESKPQLIHPVARRSRKWPVIKEKRAALSNTEKDLFEKIKLAEDDVIENNAQASKWQFDEAGKIAYSLIVFLRNARNCTADSMINWGPPREMKQWNVVRGLVADHRRGALSKISDLARATLAYDICKSNAEEWWDFAQEHVLLRNYPQILEIEELDKLAPDKNEETGEPLYKSTREQKILRKIKSRFVSFAQNPF